MDVVTGVQDDPARHHLPCPHQHSQHHPDQLPQGEQQQEKILVNQQILYEKHLKLLIQC